MSEYEKEYLDFKYEFIAIDYPWFSFKCDVKVGYSYKSGNSFIGKSSLFTFYGLYNAKTDKYKLKYGISSGDDYIEEGVNQIMDDIRETIKELEG